MRLRNLIRRTFWIVPLLVCSMWLLASVSAASDDDDDGPKFGPWSAPVNIGPPVNTVWPDLQPFITKDGLSLYFVVMEGITGGAPQDIWVAKRNHKTDPWGTPQKLGPAINTPQNEALPFVTIDGHWMYFVSARTGGLGKNDIYVSRRHNKREDFPTDPSGGWQEPVNLGSGVNTVSGERAPIIFEDDETGVTTLYFDSNRPGLGGFDIYASTLQPDGTFGPAVLVAELSSPYSDEHPMISRDGLEMYFNSNRPGSIPYPVDGCCGPAGQPSEDVWLSTRASTSDPWGTPENLDVVNARLGGPPVNSPFFDARPALSFDGKTLYFFSAFRNAALPGGNLSIFYDIWMTTRTKLPELDEDKE